ncbi:MAG: hypothetical protein LBJ00_08145 [Planctomycetaceae bacterium]|jgi:hypothetical protein|nr:hypothetical protein [Planctomycetaceae bacterium]
MKMKKSLLLILVIFVGFNSAGSAVLRDDSVDLLIAGFDVPPDSARLWAYWWWLNGNVDKDSITNDLTEMRKQGFSSVVLYDGNGSSQDGNLGVTAGAMYGTSEWRELYKHALKEAARLGIAVSLNIQSGWNLGGPDVKPENAAKFVVWSEIIVTNNDAEIILPQPQTRRSFYRDIAVVALPLKQINVTKNNPKQKPLNQLQAKSATVEVGGSAPNCDYLVVDEAEVVGGEVAAVEDVVILSEGEELTKLVDVKTGILKLPSLKKSGVWSVIRFGYTCTGANVSTASGNWQGLAIDHLDADAFDIYWNDNVKPMIDDAGELAGKTLLYIHTDSWELGGLNWTKTMRNEFQKRRGYDIVPYLPVLAGKILNSRDVSNRFLFDLRRTVGDLVAGNHYAKMKTKAHEFGIITHPESGGPHAAPIDSLQLLGMNDIPMSEFWSWSPRHRVGEKNRFFTKQPASAAHTHGKRFVAAEAFTNIGMHWQESFADNLKPSFDQAVCEGCNLLVWCCSTSSPQSAGLPGQEYFAGTHFNRQHTCWKYSEDFLKYINRVQFLTQQGLYAADVVQYYGDNVPNFTQGEWNNTAKSLPDYAYDVASMDVVLRMAVSDGRIFLPDGMNYKVLVLPEVSGINIDVLRKINLLVKNGATIIGSRPKRASGLANFPNTDIEVNKLVDELWGTDNSKTKIRQVGKGRIITGMTAAEVLRNDKLSPDVKRISGSLPDGQHRIKWIHRTLHDKAIFSGKFSENLPVMSVVNPEIAPKIALDNTNRTEIYFVANLVAKTDKTEIAFRVTQKQPELWNPLTGTITNAKAFRQENGQTIVPLEFASNGSIFVIFRKPISSTAKGTATDNSFQFEQILSLDENWQVTFISPFDQIDQPSNKPITITLPKLIDWTKHDSDEIKYHSGTAIYRKEFLYKKDKNESADSRIYIDLGLVREMAVISLNGERVGTLWARPFEVDVTEAIREGNNILGVEVVNHWANRIIGDSVLPEPQRRTKTNIRKLTNKTPLLESGLIGNVKLKKTKRGF